VQHGLLNSYTFKKETTAYIGIRTLDRHVPRPVYRHSKDAYFYQIMLNKVRLGYFFFKYLFRYLEVPIFQSLPMLKCKENFVEN